MRSGDPKPVSFPGVRARHLCGQSIDPVANLMSFVLASPFAERLNKDRGTDLWPCALALFFSAVRFCLVGVGVDGRDDGDVGRLLAPITYSHLLARTPLDMSNTPATRSAPPLHHPPIRSAGMTVFLLLPVTSLMVNGVLTALLSPSLKPSPRSLSPL